MLHNQKMALWIQNREKGNNSDEPNGRPKSASNESHVAVVAKLAKDDPHISIREVNARLSLLSGTVQRISTNRFTFGSLPKNGYSKSRPMNKKRRCVNVARDRFEPDGPANVGRKQGWAQTTRDTKSLSPDFGAGRECLPSSSSTRALWQLMCCLLNAPPQGHITQNQFCPKLSERSTASVQSPPPETPFFATMPLPTKPEP